MRRSYREAPATLLHLKVGRSAVMVPLGAWVAGRAGLVQARAAAGVNAAPPEPKLKVSGSSCRPCAAGRSGAEAGAAPAATAAPSRHKRTQSASRSVASGAPNPRRPPGRLVHSVAVACARASRPFMTSPCPRKPWSAQCGRAADSTVCLGLSSATSGGNLNLLAGGDASKRGFRKSDYPSRSVALLEELQQVGGRQGHVVGVGQAQALLSVPAPGGTDGADAGGAGLEDVADRVAHVPGGQGVAVTDTGTADLARLALLAITAQDLAGAAHAVFLQDTLDHARAA